MVSIEEFKKFDIVVASVKDVEDHPNAEKLYVLTIDTGSEEKTIVAGIKKFYSRDELIGRQIIVLNNLEPVEIRGVQSNGMLLATKDEDTVAVLVPEKVVKTGSTIS